MAEVPEIVRAYAGRNGGGAPAAARRVLLEQTGQMRLRPDGGWKPFTAEQWMSLHEVAFCWHARVKVAPLVTAVVDDAYEDGRGALDVRLWGRLPVAHEEGPAVDRGEAQRYLAELPWNPRAILENPTLRFEPRAPDVVRVWALAPETHVDLYFDGAGDVVRTYTETRSRGQLGPAPWEGRFDDYTEIGGVRVPRTGEVAWGPPEDRFVYWTGTIESLGWELD